MTNRKLSLQKDKVYSLQFSARLKELADSYESASALAREVGVAEGTIRKWTKGASQPKIGDAVKLARVLNTSLLWLVTGEGNNRPQEQITREESAHYVANGVNEAVLTRAIEVVDEVLALAGKSLAIERKAGIVSAVYSALNQPGASVGPVEIMRLIRSKLE